jgi:hypothetical protein
VDQGVGGGTTPIWSEGPQCPESLDSAGMEAGKTAWTVQGWQLVRQLEQCRDGSCKATRVRVSSRELRGGRNQVTGSENSVTK